MAFVPPPPPGVAVHQTPASLYVGDLHPDVNDGKLYEAFAGLDNIASIRVCRDSITGRSLGYGYVNFITPQDAIRAIEKVNHTPVNGKMIRVMWSHRDSEGRKSGIGNLFVKNLGNSVDNVRLNEIFSKFGHILSCKVAITFDGKSKGYGFVQFDNAESANAAISNLSGTIVDDKQIYVGNFVKKSERASSGPDVKYTNLYMKNLDQDVTEEQLEKKFLEFGSITKLVVAKDDNGNSRGFGFVNFDNPDDAKRAMEAINGTQLGSKILYVARAQKKAEREQMLRRQFEERRREQIQKFKGSNVYVKNVDDGVDNDELRELFSQCGTITSVKLMNDEKGISKGFGFVCFSTPEEANKAVSMLHGYMFHRKPLYVAIAQRKEERQAQLQLQFAQRVGGLAGPSAAVLPGGYPPLYYTPPPGVVPQLSPRQGMMYQAMGMRPGWRGHPFIPPGRGPAFATFQPSSFQPISNGGRQQQRQNNNRGRVNGVMLPHGGGHSAPFLPHLQQPAQSVNSLKDLTNQQQRGGGQQGGGGGKQMGNGNGRSQREVNNNNNGNGSPNSSLSSMLAAAAAPQQKQILGERLYPLVEKLKSDQAAKITGMLLEMDNSELLLLLESPESLASKVDEAVQVLKRSKTTTTTASSPAAKPASAAAGQDVLHPSFLSAEVAVN